MLSEALALMTYNAGVNCGVARGAEFLQRSLNAQGQGHTVDGIRTPHAGRGGPSGYRPCGGGFADSQEAYYRGLAQFHRFGRGWLKRLTDVEQWAGIGGGRCCKRRDAAGLASCRAGWAAR